MAEVAEPVSPETDKGVVVAPFWKSLLSNRKVAITAAIAVVFLAPYVFSGTGPASAPVSHADAVSLARRIDGLEAEMKAMHATLNEIKELLKAATS